jgi:hypothetical protein
MTMLLREMEWAIDLIPKRCGFIYADNIRGIQCLFDGLYDCSFTQVVRPNTRVEYKILWFGLKFAYVLCYQRSPVIGPIRWNVDFGYVVFKMNFFMRPVTRCFDLSEPLEEKGRGKKGRRTRFEFKLQHSCL